MYSTLLTHKRQLLGMLCSEGLHVAFDISYQVLISITYVCYTWRSDYRGAIPICHFCYG